MSNQSNVLDYAGLTYYDTKLKQFVGANYTPLVNGKVPAANLPSFVDDVMSFPTLEYFPGRHYYPDNNEFNPDGMTEQQQSELLVTSQVGDPIYHNSELEPYYGIPEYDKIYVSLDNGKCYRFTGGVEQSGSDVKAAYAEISASLALGETASTAFAGNRGKTLETNYTTLAGRVTTLESATIPKITTSQIDGLFPQSE